MRREETKMVRTPYVYVVQTLQWLLMEAVFCILRTVHTGIYCIYFSYIFVCVRTVYTVYKVYTVRSAEYDNYYCIVKTFL